MNNPIKSLTKKEWILWLSSLSVVIISNIVTGNIDFITMIAEIPYDVFFVEYDDARSGSFELWKVLKDKNATFVAGLISTKDPKLEEHDEIKKRYEEAKEVVGDQIALSPQFSSQYNKKQS